MATSPDSYAARLDVDYPERLNRLTSAFRLIWIIPILIIYSLLSGGGSTTTVTNTGEHVRTSGGGIAGGLFLATLLMILFRQNYPRWWFDFIRNSCGFLHASVLFGVPAGPVSVHRRRAGGPS